MILNSCSRSEFRQIFGTCLAVTEYDFKDIIFIFHLVDGPKLGIEVCMREPGAGVWREYYYLSLNEIWYDKLRQVVVYARQSLVDDVYIESFLFEALDQTAEILIKKHESIEDEGGVFL